MSDYEEQMQEAHAKKSSQEMAKYFWVWTILAAVLYYFLGWWGAAIPGVLAIMAMLSSFRATYVAGKIRDGGNK